VNNDSTADLVRHAVGWNSQGTFAKGDNYKVPVSIDTQQCVATPSNAVSNLTSDTETLPNAPALRCKPLTQLSGSVMALDCTALHVQSWHWDASCTSTTAPAWHDNACKLL